MSPTRREVREFAQLSNEFAAVRVSVDHRGNSPRLLVEDLETGASILLSPIELASLCLAEPDDRLDWLRVGEYREERIPPRRSAAVATAAATGTRSR